ncbi:diaminopropionate ammonia-lyase [Pedobacter lusitanus]|uniref:diaminopropionate ammonia-lyase n=1 Tax=Pedobacter lusitanus TaxID=1503925 RepID=UPI0009E4E284|nr:diaminopropionate ammonia-lyase [Pedobacter lusitanus]
MMLIHNKHEHYRTEIDLADEKLFGQKAEEDAVVFLSHHDHYNVTPLISLSGLAEKLQIGRLLVKDEGARLGIGSFKGLGGYHAVMRKFLKEASVILGREVRIQDIADPEVRSVASKMAFCAASAGNHGRGVAAAVQMLGATVYIYLPEQTKSEYVEAITKYGALVRKFPGSYDQTLVAINADAKKNDWFLISDISFIENDEVTSWVMQGYLLILKEALEQSVQVPTHIFIQAGVGGLAGALAAQLRIRYGKNCPYIVIVEPVGAACIYDSIEAGELKKIRHGLPTAMSMLDCLQPSLAAWRILTRTGDSFMKINESENKEALALLGKPLGNDPVIKSSESGSAGLTGLVKAIHHEQMRSAIGLDLNSCVLVINTEQAN